MLEAILDNIHNHFVGSSTCGRFEIASGTLIMPEALPGQYIRIVGSVLNDGVYQYPVSGLQDETFDGEVQLLSIPRAVLQISEEVAAWVADHPATDLTSESFGGYSYSRGTAAGTGAPLAWQDVFRAKLNRWRKLS